MQFCSTSHTPRTWSRIGGPSTVQVPSASGGTWDCSGWLDTWNWGSRRHSRHPSVGERRAKAFIAGSSELWAEAAIASGDDPDAAAAAAARTTAAYTG